MERRPMPKAKTVRWFYKVLDPSSFTHEVNRAVCRQDEQDGIPGFCGNESKAAAHAGIRQSQIHRLRRRSPGRIAHSTYQALMRIIAPVRREAFKEALLPPIAAADLDRYHAWMRAEGLRIAGIRGGGISKAEWGEEHQPEVDRVKRRIRRQLSSHARVFERHVRQKGHDPERLDFAWYRIIEPLLDHLECGGIERTVDDLDDREFAEFIKAGIRRERVLLRRGSAIGVAQGRARSWIAPKPQLRSPSADAVFRLKQKVQEWEARWA